MADSTTDDMTASTVEDVIAEALAAPCPHDEASMALAFEWCPDCSADREGHYGRVAAAVVAAIRGMTVEQLADLRPDLTIERALFGRDGGHYRTALDAEDEAHLRSMAAQHGGEIRSRAVGPWRAEP